MATWHYVGHSYMHNIVGLRSQKIYHVCSPWKRMLFSIMPIIIVMVHLNRLGIDTYV